MGLELEPPFKTACQWSKAQLKIRAESLSSARLLGSSLSVPPLDFEDCPRLTMRKSVSTPKSKLRSGSTSKSKPRSETQPSCKTNLEAHPSFHKRFPPGKCPGCSRDWSCIYASPHNHAFIFPCGHLLCSVCRVLLETNPEVACREVKCRQSYLNSQLKALYL